jgi:hypothetical protein
MVYEEDLLAATALKSARVPAAVCNLARHHVCPEYKSRRLHGVQKEWQLRRRPVESDQLNDCSVLGH